MILISHRGNIRGKIERLENRPEYIDDAIISGYEVEVDIWKIGESISLGHDTPQYQIDLKWIEDRSSKLWIHCKNLDVMSYLNERHHNLNYFWHQEDTVTLTSKKFIWSYPHKKPTKNSIAVMPEIYSSDIKDCIGVCSDYISNYSIWKK